MIAISFKHFGFGSHALNLFGFLRTEVVSKTRVPPN
jgi:hypothetical protein